MGTHLGLIDLNHVLDYTCHRGSLLRLVGVGIELHNSYQAGAAQRNLRIIQDVIGRN